GWADAMSEGRRSDVQPDRSSGEPAPARYVAASLPGAEPAADDELPSLLEALLLAAPEPATIQQLAEAAGVSTDRVESTLAELSATNHRGWQIVRHADRVHLATAPRFAAQVRRFLRLERESRLTGASLETLAIVAYRQPVTRAEIDAIRGVDSSGVLSTLLGRGLIEVVGRLEAL